ncbi:unnamed protein product [Medioppia subpectinata]|uniref:Uncharacterized protein n=1 Tax=Medioppia subpectinata TaxID=1979941 RepID=A0A7R9M0L4_9ACAR|nr:unnamed protein product [Medioppia subpectinata]CAG2122800.1 unnamed protein product [Medioppia subpectinata]
MFTVSMEMRAICALILPSFLGRSGRNFLIAMIAIMLIDKPIVNIAENVAEMTLWTTCLLKMGAKQSYSYASLLTDPMIEITTNLMTNNSPLKGNKEEFKNAFGFLPSFGANTTAGGDDSGAEAIGADEETVGKTLRDRMDEVCKDLDYYYKNCYSAIIRPKIGLFMKIV